MSCRIDDQAYWEGLWIGSLETWLRLLVPGYLDDLSPHFISELQFPCSSSLCKIISGSNWPKHCILGCLCNWKINQYTATTSLLSLALLPTAYTKLEGCLPKLDRDKTSMWIWDVLIFLLKEAHWWILYVLTWYFRQANNDDNENNEHNSLSVPSAYCNSCIISLLSQ